MKEIIIYGTFVIIIYLLLNWLKVKYFKKSQYFEAIKLLFTPVLFTLIFHKKLLEDISNRNYLYLIFFGILVSYFVYSFIKEIIKIKRVYK